MQTGPHNGNLVFKIGSDINDKQVDGRRGDLDFEGRLSVLRLMSHDHGDKTREGDLTDAKF